MTTSTVVSKHEYVEIVVRTSYAGNKPLQFYHKGKSYRIRQIIDAWDMTKPWIAGRGPTRRRVFWCKVPVLGTVVLHHDVADDVWRLERVPA